LIISQNFKYITVLSKARELCSRQEYYKEKKLTDVDTGMKLVVYTWFPYKSSDRCTEVHDITLLDSWVITVQERFTTNTNLFPRKNISRLNGCPMKAVVADNHWYFTTIYVYYNDSSGNFVRYIEGLEYDLLRVVLEHMNMTLIISLHQKIYLGLCFQRKLI
jgi:hypothetical protein